MRNMWLPLKSLVILLPVIVLVAAAVPAKAQDQRDATIGFYLEEANRYPICSHIEPPSCADESVPLNGELYTGYYAFLCVFNGNAQLGISGLQCAIEFDDARRSGVDIDSWNGCSNGLDLPQDGWGLISGDGNTITWDVTSGGCQREEPGGFGSGVTAVAGFFYLTAYSEDVLKVVPYRFTAPGTVPALTVGDCSTETPDGKPTTGITYELALDHTGSVGFSDDGSVTGDLPCIQRIQEETTWGSVKGLYNDR